VAIGRLKPLKSRGPANQFPCLEETMKYLVPPIVIPVVLVIAIAAYGLLKQPIVAGQSSNPAAISQPH
jgi:hypothetical protein